VPIPSFLLGVSGEAHVRLQPCFGSNPSQNTSAADSPFLLGAGVVIPCFEFGNRPRMGVPIHSGFASVSGEVHVA
jgi:hypothetical protein